MKAIALALVMTMAAVMAPLTSAEDSQNMSSQERPLSQRGIERIQNEVRHQLVMLPYYNLFDDLSYKVSPDGAVTLMGHVTRPTLKSDAGNVVKGIEGVTNVDNQIEVLPLSSADDRIRRAEYRAIYGSDQLFHYSWSAIPPIHIIVANGHVTLTGVVDSETDKSVAELKAKGVPGVFSVTNNLRISEEGMQASKK